MRLATFSIFAIQRPVHAWAITKRVIIATTTDDNKAKGNFVAIRQEGGGYILHTFHPETTELRQVAVTGDNDGSSLREQAKNGTPLDFIAAKHVRYCVYLAIPNAEREALLWQD